MKILFACVLIFLAVVGSAQNKAITETQKKEIIALVGKYSEAREKRDTVLLKSILTSDIDQLVSTGEWRTGVNEAVKGMLRSSQNSPGTRTLIVEKVRLLDAKSAIADARYEIQNVDGNIRKMWSMFVVIYEKGTWKISAIRNMLPAGQ
ncbi:MAG TPA: hypothetical protein VG737_06870 [Cyclobacteriaceae bacterium]|nr:hypothetical protein [Cyclobacteriaceae bacterium]